ncbi:enoyl-CoA hydratase/isomerase family protein [Thermodesulfobacteriota bacterium]
MEYRFHRVESREHGYAIIIFNRPEKLNVVNQEMLLELAAIVRKLDKDRDIGCIILTGQRCIHPRKGTQYPVFSVGFDVEQLANIGKPEAAFEFFKIYNEPFKAIELSETPVIAAVNGAALGFGFEIIGACDFAFAARSASFALPEIRHGAVSSWLVIRGKEKFGNNLIGHLTLTAVELDPEEAMRAGIVLGVYDDNKLSPECEELAKRIAAKSSMAKAFIKSVINRHAMKDYLEIERWQPTISCTECYQQAMSRFLARKIKHKK